LVSDVLHEIANTGIVDPRLIVIFRHFDETVLQTHADESAIRYVSLALDDRCRILVNVVNEYVCIFRITSHLVNFVLRFTERPQFKRLFGSRVGIGRAFYLLQAFIKEDVIGFDQNRAASLVLGDDFLDGKKWRRMEMILLSAKAPRNAPPSTTPSTTTEL